MTSIGYRAAVFFASLSIATAISLAMSHPRTPTAPDPMPPVGWTEVCTTAAIAMACRTYPPGDDSWQPTAPVPPRPPLPTPWPGGENAR